MDTGKYPDRSGFNKARLVHAQPHDRRSTNGRRTVNNPPVLSPLEMI
jgi:hypothetical protein